MALHATEPAFSGEVKLLEEGVGEKKLKLKRWRLKQAHRGKASSPNGEMHITNKTHF